MEESLYCIICKHPKSQHQFRPENLVKDEDLRWICWECSNGENIGIVPPQFIKSYGVPYSNYHKFPDNLEIIEHIAKERKLL